MPDAEDGKSSPTGALAKPAAARTLTTEPEGVEFGLAVDDTQVYYARRDDAIMRVPRAGGACETVTTAGGRVIGVAGGALYFFTRTEVRRLPVAGGASTVVLPATSTVQAWVDGPELIVQTKPSSDGALDGTLLSLPLSGGRPRTLLSDHRVVFNIKGNKYRIVIAVKYEFSAALRARHERRRDRRLEPGCHAVGSRAARRLGKETLRSAPSYAFMGSS